MRSDIKPLPSVPLLNTVFTYNPETGDLCWKSIPANFRRARVGDKAGTINAKSGYRVVGVSGIYYLAHRLIWKMVTGRDPVEFVDHIDGDKTNNRWANFRQANNGENIQNSKLRSDNKSGVKGVHWDDYHQSWVAAIAAGKGQKRLGRFKSLSEATQARRLAAEKLHGDFLRVA